MIENISEEVLKDSLLVLEKAIRAINKNDLVDLEMISNQVIHNATTSQDILSTTISKILYGIFKLERESTHKNIPLPLKDFNDMLIKLHDLIGLGKIHDFALESEKVMIHIEKLGHDINLENVIDRAGVKKGSKIYDHGISIAQAADTMKVSPWELYPYVGKSKLNDYPYDIDKRVKNRLAYTRGLFK